MFRCNGFLWIWINNMIWLVHIINWKDTRRSQSSTIVLTIILIHRITSRYAYSPFAKSFIISLEPVKVSIGSKANGSWRLIRTFSKSFIPVRSSMPRYTAKRTVGRMAIDRVRRTRCQRFHWRFRNPWSK